MNDPRVLTFYRAAGQRVAAARVLAAAAETLDATYLGGYGLECALKAVILARTLHRQRRALLDEEFRGQKAHNLDWLIHQVKSLGGSVPLPIVKRLRRCSTLWHVELRYQTGRRPAAECRYVLEMAEELTIWAGEQIS